MTLAARLLLLLFFSWALIACEKKGPTAPHLVEIKGQTMGTSYSVKYLASPSAPKVAEIQPLIDQLLATIEGKMSTYQDSSELSQFNLDTTKKNYHFSPETVQVIQEGLRVGNLSGGALDITVGPLVELWGFGKANQVGLPSDTQVAQAKSHIGLGKISLNEGDLSVTDPLLRIDLSAVAKGYAVDEVAGLLEVFGFFDYMVEIGGEIRLKGKKDQGPWMIGIERPDPAGRSIFLALPLTNLGMATSGDYRNYFEVDGKRYSHTIDPKTGRPVTHSIASATVIHPSSMTADAWATAMMVLGEKAGLTLANEQNLAVYMLYWDAGELKPIYSQAFEAYLTKQTATDKAAPKNL